MRRLHFEVVGLASKRDENWNPSGTAVLCSKHFSSECLSGSFTKSGARKLKFGSVPTIEIQIGIRKLTHPLVLL